MKCGMQPQTHITEKPSQWAWRSPREPRGGIQTLPLAFALDTVVIAPCFSFLPCETFKPQVEHSMVAGKRQEPSSALAGFSRPSSSPSSRWGRLTLEDSLQESCGWSVESFHFGGGVLVLGQDYMNSFSHVDRHAFFPPIESNEQI